MPTEPTGLMGRLGSVSLVGGGTEYFDRTGGFSTDFLGADGVEVVGEKSFLQVICALPLPPWCTHIARRVCQHGGVPLSCSQGTSRAPWLLLHAPPASGANPATVRPPPRLLLRALAPCSAAAGTVQERSITEPVRNLLQGKVRAGLQERAAVCCGCRACIAWMVRSQCRSCPYLIRVHASCRPARLAHSCRGRAALLGTLSALQNCSCLAQEILPFSSSPLPLCLCAALCVLCPSGYLLPGRLHRH